MTLWLDKETYAPLRFSDHSWGKAVDGKPFDTTYTENVVEFKTLPDTPENRKQLGAQPPMIAMVRSGPPLPPSIFIGSAITWKPSAGTRLRLVTFSNTGTWAAESTRWARKSVDWPRSMLAVSIPTALIRRCLTKHSAASSLRPGKCSFGTAALPRSAVPR